VTALRLGLIGAGRWGRWARRGTRPIAPRDQRTCSAYIFGAICPAEAKGAALVLPRCTTAATTLHLVEISQAVAPGAHAVVLLDQAGWHLSAKLTVPTYITLLPLPAKSRAQPGREHLAVHPRKLALQSHLHVIPGHSRPLLLRLELPHRSALAHNLHRLA
jgi:hypothetical protein